MLVGGRCGRCPVTSGRSRHGATRRPRSGPWGGWAADASGGSVGYRNTFLLEILVSVSPRTGGRPAGQPETCIELFVWPCTVPTRVSHIPAEDRAALPVKIARFAGPAARRFPGMKSLTLILAFLPLIVFSVLARFLPRLVLLVLRRTSWAGRE